MEREPYIPELKGKSALDFIRKADKVKKRSVDFFKQVKSFNRIISKAKL